MQKLTEEKNIHLLFEASLWLKVVFAFFEVVGGVLAYFVSQQFLLNLVLALTQHELLQDPRDLVANYLLHGVQTFSLSSQHFFAFFLLSHGIIKLFLTAGLMREKLSYYPAAIAVFGLFGAYQLYRFTFTHSVGLLLATILDVLVIWLTWHEYRYLHKKLST